MTYLATADPAAESPAAQLRRRYQQRKCLVCGARSTAHGQRSLFCAAHLTGWRYCAVCSALQPVEDHGRDKSRCKACSARRALAAYYADPDRCLYRIRLAQMSRRSGTRGDQLFASMRRRIALAAFVKATPGMPWRQRAALIGVHPAQLAYNYRLQCSGPQPDVDAPERAKRKRGT